MATTTQATITTAWAKISDGDCTVQSKITGVAYDFEVAVSTTTPSSASLRISLAIPITFAYKTPIWLRLTDNSAPRVVNIIK